MHYLSLLSLSLCLSLSLSIYIYIHIYIFKQYQAISTNFVTSFSHGRSEGLKENLVFMVSKINVTLLSLLYDLC